MSSVTFPRLLAAGFLAGLIMNIGEAALHAGVLGQDTEVLYKTLNAPFPNPATTIPILVGTTFLMGIVSMWLYVAIRPRFGSGAKPAMITGLVVWFFAHAWSGVYLSAGYAGIFTTKLAWVPVAWGLVEATLSILVGAKLCKESRVG